MFQRNAHAYISIIVHINVDITIIAVHLCLSVFKDSVQGSFFFFFFSGFVRRMIIVLFLSSLGLTAVV